jgi:hypothetical protein
MIFNLKALPSLPDLNCNIDHKKIITIVLQREFAVKEFDSNIDVMLIFSIVTCVAVIIVDSLDCFSKLSNPTRMKKDVMFVI